MSKYIVKIKKYSLNFFHLLKGAVIGFYNDNALTLSASLSYYTIFSLPPLLMIIISASGFIYGEDAVTGELFDQISALVGPDAAFQIQETIKNITLSGESVFATIVGIVTLLIGASSVFITIQDALNHIWGIRAKPKRGFFKFIKNRLMSFGMVASAGFLLVVSLIVSSLVDILNKRLVRYFPLDDVYLFYITNLVLMFAITTLLFTIIFKWLPDGKIVLRDCVIGASFTAFMFMIGKFVIGVYLANSATVSVYGAAGSVILILAWVYYSAMLLYFGAEFTRVYAHNHGQKIVPYVYAEKVE